MTLEYMSRLIVSHRVTFLIAYQPTCAYHDVLHTITFDRILTCLNIDLKLDIDLNLKRIPVYTTTSCSVLAYLI